MSTLVTTNLKHAGSASPNLTLNSDGTFNIGDAKVITPTGTAPIYQCRAWVNFNGTGTVAIRASGNVSSITDNGTGDYTVNFTTAMPDTNYMAATEQRTNSFAAGVAAQADKTVNNVRIQYFGTTSGASADRDCAGVSIFR